MPSEHIDQDDLAGMTPAEIVDMVNIVLDSEAALRNERDEAQRFAALWKRAAKKARSDWNDAMGYWHASAEAYGAEKDKTAALAERVRELEAALDRLATGYENLADLRLIPPQYVDEAIRLSDETRALLAASSQPEAGAAVES